MKELIIIGAPAEIQNMHIPDTIKFVKSARMCEQSESSRHLTLYRSNKSRPRLTGTSQYRYTY